MRTPAPDHDAELWFPNRPRYGPPGLPFTARRPGQTHESGPCPESGPAPRPDHHSDAHGQRPAGRERQELRLARHAGLNKYFTDFFAFVDASTTLCSQAAAERRQVTVRDVATAPVFDEASRYAILQANSRAAHSVPLVNRAGVPLGMVSSHHERPLAGFSRAQLAALWQTGVDSGRWLSWHWNTIVLDALEQLHATARNGTRN